MDQAQQAEDEFTYKCRIALEKLMVGRIRKAGIMLATLPLVSAFLWIGFDITWWTKADTARGFWLFIMHILVFAFGAYTTVVAKELNQWWRNV